MVVDIGNRLKEFRERTNTAMPWIAEETGIKKERLYKWEKGTKPNDPTDYHKLKAFLDLKEGLEVEQDVMPQLRLPIGCEPATPQTDTRLSPGAIVCSGDKTELIIDVIHAPFLGVFDGVIQIFGDSMTPTLDAGNYVCILRVNDFQSLIEGNLYFFVTKTRETLVRRKGTNSNEEYIDLVADNAAYSIEKLHVDQIAAVFKITAIISLINTANK